MTASSSSTATLSPVHWAQVGREWVVDQVGGPARLRVVVLLASVLALDGADKGTISATASNLKSAFNISNTDIGLLVTASTLVGAAFTIPVGALTDKVRRTRLLAISLIFWAAAMFFAGASQSYLWLILSRIGLGAVTATAGPTIASLTGDYFPARDRARMYGFILGGELVGTGLGFVASGFVAAQIGWRYAFWWLMIPSAILVVAVWRLAEPARGGQSRLQPGQRDIPDERDVGESPNGGNRAAQDGSDAEVRDDGESITAQLDDDKQPQPYENQILTEDPADKSLWWAVRYVLRVRTDVVIIVASALGYFYFSGLRTFAILFTQDHYGISKTMASSLVLVVGVGALAGVYAGGRVTDRLLKRGVVAARVIVPTVVLFAIPLFLAPAFWVTELWIAVPLLTIGAGLLGSANPPQDAARLDVIHPHLWGRSEGIRSAIRGFLEGAAPVTFGWVSDHLFGGNIGFGATTATPGSSHGLEDTFLLFLVILVIAGGVVLVALRTYPRDVATADRSAENTLGAGRESQSGTSKR